MVKQKSVKKTTKNDKYIVTYNRKNFGKLTVKGVNMSTENVNTADTNNAKYNLLIINLIKIVFSFVKNFGILIFGIFVGMGIVLRDPPVNKKTSLMVKQLEEENTSLKSMLQQQENIKIPAFGEIKNGFVIKK